MPAISIVMPIYNAKDYLDESIESILSQTFTDFELIIVDDGSTDISVKIVNSYKDKRIRLLRNSHNFIKTLNLGVEASNGKYIVRMDADDFMLPQRLEVQFNYMEDNPDIDVCGSWMETFGTHSQISKTIVDHNDIAILLLKNNYLFHPTVIMRRESLQRYKSYPHLYKSRYIYAEDYKLWTDLIKSGFRFANIPEVLLRYRISQGQTSDRHNKRQRKTTLLIQQQYSEYISNLIVEKESYLYEYFNSSIQLLNTGKIMFNSFKSVVADLYADLLSNEQIMIKKVLPVDSPLVSVVMPVYNVEEYIKEAIDSIVSQTYSKFELIIINDGSTDRTVDIIKEIVDKRIVLIDHSNNKGNYIRRNEGCKLANGKYICVMDGDDVAIPNRIEKQVRIMENDPLLLAHGTAFILSNGNVCYKPYNYNLIKIMLLSNNTFLHSSLIVRKDILDSVGYYNEDYIYASDYDLVCKLAIKGKIINTPDILMKYRIHKKQISSAHYKEQSQYANQIRIQYLQNLGFKLSVNEKKIFTMMITKSTITSLDISHNKMLISKLIKQNKESEIFTDTQFSHFINSIFSSIYR